MKRNEKYNKKNEKKKRLNNMKKKMDGFSSIDIQKHTEQ